MNDEKKDLETYKAYKTLIFNNEATPEIGKKFMVLRKKIIDDKLNYLKSQLKNCKITFEEIHNHPLIRIDREEGYDYSLLFEQEIFNDPNWIGHCSSCLKPMFKGDMGYFEDGSINLHRMSWRGCVECSQRNGLSVRKLNKGE